MKRAWIILLSIIIVTLMILFFYFAKQTKKEIRVAAALPEISNIPDINLKEGMKFPDIELDKFISSEFTGRNEYRWSYSANKKLSVTISNNILKIKSDNPDWFGKDTVSVHLYLQDKLIDSKNFVVKVLPVNDAPFINPIPILKINEGENFPSIFLGNIVSDIDNNLSQLTWKTSGAKHIHPIINKNILSFASPDKNWFGSDTIKLTVVDPGKLKYSQNIILHALPVNDPPEISEFPVQVISEGEQFPSIDLSKFISDPDDRFEDFKFSFSGNRNVDISLKQGYLNATVSDSNWNGNDTLLITASDKGNLTSSRKLIFICRPINDPPVLTKIPDNYLDDDQNFHEIDLNKFASDIDDSTLHWTTSHNGNLQINIDDKNIMRVSRTNQDWFGTDTITFRVADKETFTEATSLITFNGTSWLRKFPVRQLQNVALVGVNDVISLSSEFISWDKKKIISAAAITAFTAVLISTDDQFHNEITSHKSKPLSTISDIGEIYGETYTTEIAAASLGLYGLIANDSKVLQLGLEVYESYLIANNISLFLKKAFGRSRPNIGIGSDRFELFPGGKANKYAFPSGHATLAFSLSTVLSSTTDNYYLKALFYVPAAATAFSRMYTDHHWASDVFFGGAIGFLVGNYLVNRHRSPQSNNIIYGFDDNGRIEFKYYF